MAPQLNVSIDLCVIIHVVHEHCGIFGWIKVKKLICNIILHIRPNLDLMLLKCVG